MVKEKLVKEINRLQNEWDEIAKEVFKNGNVLTKDGFSNFISNGIIEFVESQNKKLISENERLGKLVDKLNKDYQQASGESKYHAREMSMAQQENKYLHQYISALINEKPTPETAKQVIERYATETLLREEIKALKEYINELKKGRDDK